MCEPKKPKIIPENKSTKDLLFDLVKKHGYELDVDAYCECSNFLFFTSWYEELLFTSDKHQSPYTTRGLCHDLFEIVNMEKLDFYGDHFSDRYFPNLKDGMEQESHYFINLRLNEKYKKRIKDSLINFKKDSERNEDLLWAYLMIAYRFRNNMFHGGKGIINLKKYVEQFRVINRFLYILLSAIIEKGFRGYGT